jgi:hypothetical protein
MQRRRSVLFNTLYSIPTKRAGLIIKHLSFVAANREATICLNIDAAKSLRHHQRHEQRKWCHSGLILASPRY